MKATLRSSTPLLALLLGCGAHSLPHAAGPMPSAPSAPGERTSTPPPPPPTQGPVTRGRRVGQLVYDGVPKIPEDLADRIRRFQNSRSASLVGWRPDGEGLYIRTRFGATAQLHFVDRPLGARRQLTFFDEPVSAARIAPKSGRVVLLKDVGGNEFAQVFLLDEATGEVSLLTDGKSKNAWPCWSGDGRQLAYSSTERNGKDFDLWVYDAETNKRTLFFEATGYWVALDWSPDGQRLLALHYVSATRSELVVLEAKQGIVADLTPKERDVAFSGARFSEDGERVFYVSDLGGEYKRLVVRDLAEGTDRVLTEDVSWSVEALEISPDGRTLAVTFNEGGFSRLTFFDARSGRQKLEPKLPPGILSSLEFDAKGRKLAFTLESPSTPGDVYAFDLSTQTLTRWTASETGGLDPKTLARTELFEYPTFDARKIPGLVVRPKGEGPHPVVVVIHGGPESQSRPYFSAYDALFVGALEAAVIRPNVRGSTGYGRSYTLLDNADKREDSVKDIGALLDWIATQPDLDEHRVALVGGSYGGYMVLAGGVHYSDRVKALVDIVGISSFVTFLESTKKYRRDLRRQEYGDERDPKMRALLEQISPLNNAEKIRAPLFVVQGKNDPRVPASESEQIVERVRKSGKPVWYMLAEDEGHGFRKKPNRDAMLAAIYMFLEQHLLR